MYLRYFKDFILFRYKQFTCSLQLHINRMLGDLGYIITRSDALCNYITLYSGRALKMWVKHQPNEDK